MPRFDTVLTLTPESFVVGLYFALLACLSVYGLHRCYLLYLYTRYPPWLPACPAAFDDDELPFVTVQLAVYNERYVVERLIDAAARLDYPRDRFEVQVLDDSTDDTGAIVDRAVAQWARRGVAIRRLHRAERTGYKAGALAAGLRQARGDVLAIFDADFLPPVDFLRQTVPALGDPQVGMVQARWGHLNQSYSLLTRVQAMLLDAHFVLEHGARSRGGCFFNFNGTAGLWRRRAIEEAGGWQSDTLTEDLDLSYRAQLAGWRFVFLPDVVAPAEIPVEMDAFKVQQYRWAKGSIQTCRKLLPAILRADVPGRIKAEACFHLTANLNCPLLVALSVIMLPALLLRASAGTAAILLIDVPVFCLATMSLINFYAISQRAVRRDWLTQLWYVPLAMAVGIGLSVNNTRAVLDAITGRGDVFRRTPKYAVVHATDEWRTKRYRERLRGQPIVELAFGLYFTVGVVWAAAVGMVAAVPFLCLFQVGFLYVAVVSLVQRRLPLATTSRAGEAAGRGPATVAAPGSSAARGFAPQTLSEDGV